MKAIIEKRNEAYIKIYTTHEVEMMISNKFTFMAPGFFMNPDYRTTITLPDGTQVRRWDGKIRLFNRKTKQIYLGLFKEVISFLKTQGVEVETDVSEMADTYTVKEIEDWISQLDLPFKEHKHQKDMVVMGLMYRKAVMISPTASGKSYAIYLYIRFLLEKVFTETDKILLVVPTTNLVNQMKTDFAEYDIEKVLIDDIHCIMGGKEKDADKRIYISTWQSIYKLKEPYFKKFKSLIIDECCVPGTEIAVADNDVLRKIENIKIGDVIFSYNSTVDIIQTDEVINTFCKEINEEIYDIYLGGIKISLTAGHPICVKENGKIVWKEVERLKVGDDILSVMEI